MDSNKLKALKVVDLKAILAKANVQVPAKSTKSDLIARIQASKPAQDAYRSLYPQEELLQISIVPPQDDLLAPPEDVDWNVEQPVVVPTPPAKEPKQLVTNPKPSTPPTVTAIDPELEKRQKRAERFGIPLIELKKNPSPADSHAKKLEERRARFGLPASSNDKKNLKRPAAQADVVDREELEKRRKRAERFGITK